MKVSEAIAALQRELTENGDSDMEVSLESQAPEHISDTIEKNVNYCQERIAHFAVY